MKNKGKIVYIRTFPDPAEVKGLCTPTLEVNRSLAKSAKDLCMKCTEELFQIVVKECTHGIY